MKFVFPALASLGLVGALAFVAPQSSDVEPSALSAQQRKEALVSYKLRVSGREESCTVVKHGTIEAERADLELDENCVHMLPRLADARYWKQESIGEVTFAAADGRPIVEFFAADGVAYESLHPVSPLVALTVQ